MLELCNAMELTMYLEAQCRVYFRTKTWSGIDFGFGLHGLNSTKVLEYHQFNEIIDVLLFYYPQPNVLISQSISYLADMLEVGT